MVPGCCWQCDARGAARLAALLQMGGCVRSGAWHLKLILPNALLFGMANPGLLVQLADHHSVSLRAQKP